MKLRKKFLLPGLILLTAVLIGAPGFSADISRSITGGEKRAEAEGPAGDTVDEVIREPVGDGGPQKSQRGISTDPAKAADSKSGEPGADAEQFRKDTSEQSEVHRTTPPAVVGAEADKEKNGAVQPMHPSDDQTQEIVEPKPDDKIDPQVPTALTPGETVIEKDISVPLAAEPPVSEQSEPKKVPEIEPLYVKALNKIAAGHNDSNPIWSPSGQMIAYERSMGDKREIIVSHQDGSVVQKIYCRLPDGDGDMDFFFPGIVEDISYNSGITWSPDESSLVFMSNGGSGNYDLYLLPALGDEKTIRLTEHTEKDSHPHWNPLGDRLVFVSGRTGKAEIFIMDLKSRKAFSLTSGKKTYLYPRWSPDGKKIVMIYGSNENHDVYLIEDIARPTATLKALTSWEYDDLGPVWSPDGNKIAFYSNYNLENNPKVWSIVVIAANGSSPDKGQGLVEKIVAQNVIPDIERGPAWMPDSKRIVYVKNDEQAYNPLYIVNVEEGTDLTLKTDTKMNHDVVSSKDGTLAFRAQTEQWDHIYIARLKE